MGVRYLITGGSGYIGSRLVGLLHRREQTEEIVISDVVKPRAFVPKTRFAQLDVRNRAAVRALIERERPDVLIHLAFILNPARDEGLMYDVDVNGTAYVLEAAASAGTGHVLVTSSTTAYGAFPDNPVPLSEDDPVRGAPHFPYARDKTEADRLCQLWARDNPDRVMTLVRPCIVFGPNVDNYIVRLWTKQPFQADIGNMDNPIQFVHEDDLVEALTGLLDGRHAGAFNITGDGLMTQRECAEIAGVPTRKMPLRLFRGMAKVMWAARQSEAPPGQIDFARYPWVASNEKVKETLGWQPRHTSREAFEITMRTHGKEAPAPVAPAPAA